MEGLNESRLEGRSALLDLAERLLYLPDDFPSAHLQVEVPLINTCLTMASALEHLPNYENVGLALSVAEMQEAVMGFGLLNKVQAFCRLSTSFRLSKAPTSQPCCAMLTLITS
ncbi:unnamed protein product [Symbiodinium natans]|uniref:Uncharacterized protein n=1 Tax=Symbiodinium natans TaxID=878477 RepID=A0A812I7Q7_9DINO|nr:unnamed protein product [Symbiodinium natans]